LLFRQSNKGSSISERGYGRFSAQNGKDEPNSRVTRAWQKNDKETNVKGKKIEICIDRSIAGGFAQSAVAYL
jgi:hypothetical protein